jgi:hypothetical protein
MLLRTLILLLLATASHAADSLRLIKSIPMQARMMTVDELGNVYVVRQDNSMLRLTEQGDSSAVYRSIQNGNIGQVDATNPLRIVLYYPAYQRIVLLDKMLTAKNELDLKKLHIYSTAYVASAADGDLWVYDLFNARLIKVSEQLSISAQSNDLRQQVDRAPQPSFIVERNRKVYLCDTAQGIFTFDQYGSYINTLSIYGARYLQVIGSQLVYRNGDTLHSFDMKAVRDKVLPLPPGDILNAAVGRNVLYVLYADRLVLFRVESRK